MRRAAMTIVLALVTAVPARADDLAARAMPAGHTKIFIGQTSVSYVDAFAKENSPFGVG